MKNFRTLIILVLVISNIGCDQISKKLARQNIEYGEVVEVIPNYFTMTKVENSGAFLSMGNNLSSSLRILLLIVLPALVLIGLLFYVLKKTQLPKAVTIGLTFIIGGGIGNLYDRIVNDAVTDFLFMDFQLFHTGIFNLADVSIMIGTFLLLLASFTEKKAQEDIA